MVAQLKKGVLHWFLFLLFLLVFLFCCHCEKNREPIAPASLKPRIMLALAEKPRLREIRLKVELQNVELPHPFLLTRNDREIFNQLITTRDTVIRDADLLPATGYYYRAYLLKNGIRSDSSNLLETRTMDTTSHNYLWTIDTLGGIGSVLYDVFALSEDNVWAVGKIDTGVYPPFNAVHWNGSEWELKRIPFTGWCSAVEFPTIKSVFAFSDNDIWFARGGSLVHYDGNSYYNDCEMNSILAGSINKIWGTNSNNIFVVGGSGTIVHYQSGTWQKIESGTQLRLTDVWGFPDCSVYITGSSSSTLDNVFLVFKDNQLQQKVDDAIWRKKSVWGTSADRLYVAGSGLFFYDGNNLTSLPWPSNLPFIHIENLRGSEENNIFMVGHFGFVAHFNGSTWRYYPELYRYAIASAVAVTENQVFVVGMDGMQAFIYRGRKSN